MVQRARLAAAANIQHDRAAFGGAGGPALLDGVGLGIGRRPIIDPLLKDGRLLPLFRDRAIGKAAYDLVPSPASRNAAARTVASWLMAEGRATAGASLTAEGAGGDLSDRENKTKKPKGQKR